MNRELSVLALVILICITAVGQGKKKTPMPPAPPPRENPMESPHRLLVNIQTCKKITLNGEDVAGLKRLEEILEKILEGRAVFQQGVIIQAQPEMKYGEWIAALDVIANPGGSPIIVFIENRDDYVTIEMTEVPVRFRGLSTNLPSVDYSAPTPVSQKEAAIVTIPQTGIYVVRGVRISSGDEGYEQTLASQLGLAMEKLRTVDPYVLYVNCDKDALYSDIQRLIKAAHTHTGNVALWVKSKPGQPMMGIIKSSRRRSHRR